MKALTITAVVVGTVALAAVATVAIWASVADAPWENEDSAAVATPRPTPRQKASFTRSDVLALTVEQVTNRRFPSGTTWVRCVDADYRSGNRVWVVTCDYFENRDDRISDQSRTYTFDDRTGKLQ